MLKSNRINNKNFRKLSDIKRLDQSLTNESKRIRNIENELTRKLNAIAREISKFKTTDIALLRRVFDAPVNEIIRSALQKTYTTGLNYTADFYSVDGFLTQIDFDNIKATVLRYTDQFWRFVDKGILHRNDLLIRDKRTGKVKPPRDPLVDAGFVASAAVVRMMNIATLSKAKQLAQKNRQQTVGYRFAAVDDDDFDTGFELYSNYDPENEQNPHVLLIWKTADDLKVCDICESVADETYELDDPMIPVPPEVSHPNCRCRLMLTQVDIEGYPVNVPYSDTEQDVTMA